jgi:molecular chaperone GrpE
MTDDDIAEDAAMEAELNAEDAADGLEAEIASLKAENAALKDQALRFAAEAENTRRRAEREANDARAFAIQKFARDLLGVADNLSRALQHAPKGDDQVSRNLAIGLEMTQKGLLNAFERNGLKALDPPPGEKFDPHKHQAMMEQTSSEVAPGGVITVLQTGYELFGRVLRPAMVSVAAKDSVGQGQAAEVETSAPADAAD